MTKFRSKYRIEPNRWMYWDYSAPGRYFITICINNRECILGDVVNKKMELSEYGAFIETEIRKIPEYNPRIILDEWQVMPNHIHIIIELGEYNYNNGIANVDDDNVIDDGNVDGCCGNVAGCDNVEKIHEFSLPTIDEIKQYRIQRRKMIIPKILGKLKMKTSKQINDARKNVWSKKLAIRLPRPCYSRRTIIFANKNLYPQ
ncbi:MAG: hypothetical protein JXR50_11025 [Prolixibacteraceae bacterium]|nr:hypothetical protein [Prolixibacteraceae bacterium]MBN2650260.1 hypothetical protein [Prolixibacteraceae bacterium]